MKDINLQEFCKELHIYEFGIAPWPLPDTAKDILYESNPQLTLRSDYGEQLNLRLKALSYVSFHTT